MLGFRTGKANPDLFFDSFLPKAYFRILRRRAGHNKQTKNIKNKFSRGQSSGESASWSVQGPGSDLSMDDKTSLGQSQLCAKASETALQSPRSTRLLMAKQEHFHDTPGCFCCDKDDP